MSERLLLDEHYAEAIALALRDHGHDVVAVVSDPELRSLPDPDVFRRAAAADRRVITENVKDFRPLLLQAYASGDPTARLLLVPPARFPRSRGRRNAAIVAAVLTWLDRTDRPDEDWLF